ncbi:transposase family protein [Mycobacterium ulcerans str. Harvey]|uniref:Transposase family protein n=1 Tax=Mycobacterium ulcerans str. Harvey TaxID=1299332 RepID=A0ABN0RAA2_MYCUL|nr:transposase family protein [Mycobacterium ulcerans str. Harvey]
MGSYFTAHVASSDPVDWCRSRWTARCCVVALRAKADSTHLVSVFAHRADWCSVNSLSREKQ